MNLALRIKQIADQHFDAMVANRRHLHRNPELSFEEFETTKFIAEKLKETGYDLQTITETGGYIDILGKNHSSKVIALRGDIDAYPFLKRMRSSINHKMKVKCTPVVMMCIPPAYLELCVFCTNYEKNLKVQFGASFSQEKRDYLAAQVS